MRSLRHSANKSTQVCNISANEKPPQELNEPAVENLLTKYTPQGLSHEIGMVSGAEMLSCHNAPSLYNTLYRAWLNALSQPPVPSTLLSLPAEALALTGCQTMELPLVSAPPLRSREL